MKIFHRTDNGRTEYIATNDLSQSVVDATYQDCLVSWKIEQLHLEIREVISIGKCQFQKFRTQRNHSACCFQVWVCLKHVARKLGKTIYEVKQSLLDDYMQYQLSKPSIIFNNA